jgi:hypothetical protein
MAKKDETKEAPSSGSSASTEERVVAASPEEGHESGVWGVETDPTPNHNYTVDGVIAAAPTPETDEEAAIAAANVNLPGQQAGVRG